MFYGFDRGKTQFKIGYPMEKCLIFLIIKNYHIPSQKKKKNCHVIKKFLRHYLLDICNKTNRS